MKSEQHLKIYKLYANYDSNSQNKKIIFFESENSYK